MFHGLFERVKDTLSAFIHAENRKPSRENWKSQMKGKMGIQGGLKQGINYIEE
jgi:hypothetical protein